MTYKAYTFLDVYHAARDDRKFEYCFWLQITLSILGDYLFMVLGRLLVIVASFLILTIGASGFLVVLPAVATPWTLWFNFNIIWGTFLVFSIIFNYLSAVITDPGSPIKDDENSIETANNSNGNVRNRGPSCKKCAAPKPARTHHCSICKKCVLKMDHHCPWVNNCIGLNNYRYFYSFLLWTCFGTAYLAFLIAPTVLREGSLLRVGEIQYETDQRAIRRNSINLRGSTDAHGKGRGPRVLLEAAGHVSLSRHLRVDDVSAKPQSQGHKRIHLLEELPLPPPEGVAPPSIGAYFKVESRLEWMVDLLQSYQKDEFTLSMIFILSGAISFAVGILFVLHTYLVLSAQTTIEFFLSIPDRSKFKKAGRTYLNPYDRGWRANVKQVFGHTLPLFFSVCLPSWRPPPQALGSNHRNSSHPTGSSGSAHSEC